MLDKFFKQKSKERVFWDWFSKKENSYFHFEPNQTSLFNELKDELKKVHLDLVFEFSRIRKDGTREFIISSDGIKSAFPAVIHLVEEAPTLKNWKIIAFRQPHLNITHIHYQNLVISLDDIFFQYCKDNGKIGVELNIKGFYESPEWTAAAFILLDNVLGEYHTETSLSYIDKKELDEKEISTLFPIRALPQIIQDYNLEFSN